MAKCNHFLAAISLQMAFTMSMAVGGPDAGGNRGTGSARSDGEAGQAATTFYVSPAGNDASHGAAAAPLATLHRAVQAARASPGPRRIVVQAGTYYLTSTIILGPRDSGLVIEGVRGKQVVLSGGRRVTGWKPWKGEILRADLATLGLTDLTFREVYYNTKLQPWARVPNADPEHPRTGGFLRNAGIVEKETKTKLQYRQRDLEPGKWAHPDRAWVMFHDALNYQTQYCPVRRIDPERRIIEAGSGVYRLSVGNPFYVCGLLEELDAPGEWCVDPDEGMLYFWPPDGDPNGDDQLIVPSVASAFVLEGEAAAGKWVENVRLSGLDLRDFRGQAVKMTGAKGCVVARCDLRNAEVGVYLGNDTHACQVRGCDVTQTQGDGVSILGTTTDHQRVTDHVVDNCYIRDIGWGRIHNRCGGVYMHRCARVRLTHNHVHDSPRYALAMDVGNDCEFAYNYCHHVNLVTTDSGIIEAATAHDWGLPVDGQRARHKPHNWGNTVHHNLIHDSGGWRTSGEGELEFPAFTWGIYLDLDCSGWHVHDNVCYNTVSGGFMLNGGTDNLVENNVFADGKQHQIRWNPWRGYTMARNRCQTNVFSYAGKTANLYTLSGFQDDYVRFERNLVHAHDGRVRIGGVAGMGGKDVWNAWQKRGQDRDSLLADPLFVDPVKRDYRLKPESPAFELGFEAIDLSSVGNYASPDRRTWPRPEERVVRDAADYRPADVFDKPQTALRTYEDYALGESERNAQAGDRGAGSAAVTDETAASGKHSLKFTDAAGIGPAFFPYITYPLVQESGTLKMAFDLRWEKDTRIGLDWRDDPHHYNMGPNLNVTADGMLLANGKRMLGLPAGQWVHVEIVCRLGSAATGKYDLTLVLPNADPQVHAGIACSPKFETLNCVVFMATGDAPGVFYLDNLEFTHALSRNRH
ncbi:MAG: right-handed parallel beta-helix repeat-containing protein [Planctomycetes bacterium]|nr:right-handed parallel beta-helix repeat-containing protein [Planctomycetota bacterium]